MRERYFARFRESAAAHDGDMRNGMVRRTKRRPIDRIALLEARRLNVSPSLQAYRHRSEAGGFPQALGRASSSPSPAGRKKRCCGGRRRQSPSARLALSCPFTSARSSAGGGVECVGHARGAEIIYSPFRLLTKFSERLWERRRRNTFGKKRLSRILGRHKNVLIPCRLAASTCGNSAYRSQRPVQRKLADKKYFLVKRRRSSPAAIRYASASARS